MHGGIIITQDHSIILKSKVIPVLQSQYCSLSSQIAAVHKYLKYLFAAKGLSLQVVRVYYATPQVDKQSIETFLVH